MPSDGHSARRDRFALTRPVKYLAAAGLASLLGAASAQTLQPEVQVSTAAIPDYEFDSARNGVFCLTCNFGNGNARFAFSDADGKLWVGYIDFNTGAFYPPDGHGVLVDTNTAPVPDFGNGPEWVLSTAGSQLVYTRYTNGKPHSNATATIASAAQINGSWSAQVLANSAGRATPAGSLDASDTDPRIHYIASDKSAVFWRSASQIGVEKKLPISDLSNGNARRWVPGTRKLILQGQPAGGPQTPTQVFLVDTDTNAIEQLTFDANAKVGAFMWAAPEYGNDFVFMTMASSRKQILVYRKIAGGDGVKRWTVIKTINAPTQLPYFFSPEPFTHNGRSYIFSQVSSSSDFTDKSVPTQIALSGIDPLRLNFRMLTNDSATRRVRLDPEYFITSQGPFIYYNRLIPQTTTSAAINDGVWRVDTKLGPPVR